MFLISEYKVQILFSIAHEKLFTCGWNFVAFCHYWINARNINTWYTDLTENYISNTCHDNSYHRIHRHLTKTILNKTRLYSTSPCGCIDSKKILRSQLIKNESEWSLQFIALLKLWQVWPEKFRPKQGFKSWPQQFQPSALPVEQC